MRMALEDDGVSRRVAENVASGNNDKESQDTSLFGRKMKSSNIAKFKILFNVARWGIKDPNVPEHNIDRKELANAERFNDTGSASLPLGEFVSASPHPRPNFLTRTTIGSAFLAPVARTSSVSSPFPSVLLGHLLLTARATSSPWPLLRVCLLPVPVEAVRPSTPVAVPSLS